MITKQITDPMYDVRLDIIAKCSAEEADAFIKKKYNYDPELDKLAYGTLIQYRDGKHFILWMKTIRSSVIIHEVSHLIDDIYAYRDIKHTCGCPGCSEHRAYQITGWASVIKAALK